MSDTQPQEVARSADNLGPDPLAGLYHMSNTAGVSAQDYVAVNPTAIAAILLGFASVLTIFSSVLLLIPLLAVACAIVAMVQVSRSNGTQTGKAIAIVGLLLGLVFGAGRVGHNVLSAQRLRADARQMSALMHDFAQDVTAERYDAAYQRFGESFHVRVPKPAFEQVIKRFFDPARLGALQSIDWNQEPPILETRPDSGEAVGIAMGLAHFSRSPEPGRITFTFESTGGKWRLYDIPTLFPPAKQ